MLKAVLAPRVAVPLVLAVLVVGLSFALPSNFYLRVAALVWISALAVIGLNLLMGYAGQVSLGHAGFFGIGAYAVAVLPAQFSLHPLIAALAGAVVAGLVAFLVGRPILRLKGHYLAVATLGFGMLIAMTISNEAWLTGGPDGMPVERLTLFGWRVRGADTWYWDHRRAARHRRVDRRKPGGQPDGPGIAGAARFGSRGAGRRHRRGAGQADRLRHLRRLCRGRGSGTCPGQRLRHAGQGEFHAFPSSW